jgi:PAS domain S-box-containing protein
VELNKRPIIPVEEQFKIMADSAPVLIWISGTDKLCCFFNEGWLRFTGRTMDQEYGNGWAEGVHPDDRQRWLDVYTANFDARKAFRMEYRLRRHDGVYRWLLNNGVPRYLADGTFAGFIGSCIDIDELLETERNTNGYIRADAFHNEQALNEELTSSNEELAAAGEEMAAINEELSATNDELQQSKLALSVLNEQLEERVRQRTLEVTTTQAEVERQRDRLTSFFMQATSGICILDGPDLVFELVNPAYQQLLPNRQLINRPIFEALPELIGQPLHDVLLNVYANGVTYEVNELLIPVAEYEGGPTTDRYFSFNYLPRVNVNKEVDGILVFVFEVTAIVTAKHETEKVADHLRAQLNAMPQIAWTSKVNGEVDFYNQKWFDYTGLDFEQTQAWGWKEVIHPDDLQYNLQQYGQIIHGYAGGEFEIRERRNDGEFRWHLVRIVPVKDKQGVIKHWTGTATDIHDLKLLQQQKDDFISIASHELKTPVTSLKASLQLMDKIKGQPNQTVLPKLIEQANRSINKVSDLIGDLLDASKVNENQLQIVKTNFKIFDMLNGCSHHVRASGNHQLIFQGDKDLRVFADEHRLDQVIENFVNNAVKYAPDSKNIYLIAEKEGNNVKISVRDAGPGIHPDKVPHLFSKYYRAEYTGAQYSGLGLGLYICAEIIKKHGGQIGVDSKIGNGSTFWFTIPA